MIKDIIARRNEHAAMKGVSFGTRLRGYVQSVWHDVVGSLGRVLHDRGAWVAIAVMLVPWAALVYIRRDWSWLESFGEIVFVGFVVWWLSRSGGLAGPGIRYPVLESILAFVLVLLWIEWRIGICARFFPFLPSNFNCFENADYEIVPKLVENVLVPFAILFVLGYRWRAMGINWSWRAWWICLPALLMAAGVGLYLHQKHPLTFVQGIGSFFFGAGLPEEFLFRMVLLTRLEAWWKRPSWALLAASVIFGLSHLPIDYLVFTRNNLRETILTALTFQMGFGFVFCFAFQRTRNIWPLAILHAMIDAM